MDDKHMKSEKDLADEYICYDVEEEMLEEVKNMTDEEVEEEFRKLCGNR